MIERLEFLKLLNSFENAKYNISEKLIDVSLPSDPKNRDYDFFLGLYTGIIEFLEEHASDHRQLFREVKLADIKLAYYANCLAEYPKQVLDDGLKHHQTCWGGVCEKTTELGYLSNKGELDFDQQLKKLSEKFNLEFEPNENSKNLIVVNNWVKIMGREHNKNNYTRLTRIKSFLKKIFLTDQDRVIKLIKLIRSNGFKEKQFYGSASSMSGVLGYSSKTKNYMIFHGKHRIAVLKYLQSKGEIDNKFEISIPFLRYNFNHFKQSAPGMQCKCKI